MKQKKSVAWKERQGLQRKEQATKQKQCVSVSVLLELHAVDVHDFRGHLQLQHIVPLYPAQAGRQPESAGGYQGAEQKGQARKEADAGRI